MSKARKRILSKIDGFPVRPSGPWIERKFFYLKRYADIFTRGMSRKWKTSGLTYIDLFAGPGKCLVESTGEEINGSPLLALQCEFTDYIFIEQNKDDFRSLQNRCADIPKNKRLTFIQGDCNQQIAEVRPKGLSLAFIDPTGIDIHFQTIRSLTHNRQVDLLMNIQFGMDIKRNLQRYRDKERETPLDLFLGGKVPSGGIKSARDVLEIYRDKIKALGYSTAEYRDIVVSNSKRVPMYFLFFASKHPRGLEFWRKITGKDETGQTEFRFGEL